MPQRRKVLYFLGAGASYGAGATAQVQGGGTIRIPTQRDFWETFLRFSKNQASRNNIESFLFRYFMGYGKVPSRSKLAERRRMLNGIDVEEVFTFLSERTFAPSTSPQLRTYAAKVWQDLVTTIGDVFRRFKANSKTKHVYRTLLRNHIRSYDGIVSFNYDTIFEDSLPIRYAWAYEGIEKCQGRLPIIKPHGSVNWALNDANAVIREPTPKRCVLVAPTHLKFITGPKENGHDIESTGYLDQATAIQKVWGALEREMRDARALVFIGYSFPMADLYFSSLLRSVIAIRDSAPGVVIVNPDAVSLATRLSKRFAIRNLVRYFDMSQFVQASRQDVFAQIDESSRANR
jgi:hypothetical protein